ncbi:MAG TPA: hypothetical protein PLO00_03270, partial [Usitatibacteraceae bacterium]|nr:hypothetical protein [Usitatibacteraceae bacterium]
MNPLDFPPHLRADGEARPRVLLVVVLAAADDAVEQAACLELGADACLPHDVPGPLLWAQVKALLRRAP